MPDEQVKETPFMVLVSKFATRPGVRAFCLIVLVLTLCFLSIKQIEVPPYFKEVLLFIGGSYITSSGRKDGPVAANPKEIK